MATEPARKAEHSKYINAYQADNYRMGARRKMDAMRDLEALPTRGSYLDVSCGCGEMLTFGYSIGFDTVNGTEIVPGLIENNPLVEYAEVHALPFADDFFNVASLFDVIEHLLPGDDELACRELARVATDHILLTANNRPSHNHLGEDLHINIRSYEEWDDCFRSWFDGATVTRLKDRVYVSEGWRIDL